MFVNKKARTVFENLFTDYMYDGKTTELLNAKIEEFKSNFLVSKGVEFDNFHVTLEQTCKFSAKDNNYHKTFAAVARWLEKETEEQHNKRIELEKYRIDNKIRHIQNQEKRGERKKTVMGRAIMLIESYGGVVTFPNGVKKVKEETNE